MKIVFVNPPVTKKERYGALAPAGSYAPPLALCSLAGVTRKNGHETIIVDSQVEELGKKETLDRIKNLSPEIVGITSTTSTFLSAAELAKRIKNYDKNILVVAGGVHVSALPEESLLKYKDFDIAVMGEGEETFAELITVLKEKNSIEKVKGIAFRKNGEVVLTGSRPLIKDLDTLPLPAWDLLPDFPDAYNVQAQSVANSPSTSVCTSRGCTGKCTFCDRRIFGDNLRAHSAEYVVKMIKDLYHNYGIRDIQFEDDNYVFFRKRLIKISEILKKEKLDLTWSCQARGDMVKLGTLKMMKETGCWMVLYGVESGSQKILDFMKKEISIQKMKQSIDETHKAGMLCKGFFIAGYLNEDKSTLKETYQFIKNSKLDDISFHYYIPFPGSADYERARKFGNFNENFSDMTYYKPVFIPEGLTDEDLIKHTKACYRRFYLKPRIILNYLKRIKDFSHFSYYVKSCFALFYFIISKKD